MRCNAAGRAQGSRLQQVCKLRVSVAAKKERCTRGLTHTIKHSHAKTERPVGRLPKRDGMAVRRGFGSECGAADADVAACCKNNAQLVQLGARLRAAAGSWSYGMCGCFLERAVKTDVSADRLLLIACVSFNAAPAHANMMRTQAPEQTLVLDG